MTWAVLRRTIAVIADGAKTAATRHPTLAAGVGYLLIVVSLFRELVFQGRVLFERDIHIFWQPRIESLVRAVTTPAWPVWDLYSSFGQPFLADASTQILYPPTWLNLVMQPWTYYSLFAIAHIWLAGLGLWRLARALGLSWGAAFTAGALWMTSGPLLSSVSLYHHFAGACWMPWVLLAAESVALTPNRRRAAAWALAAGVQVAAGSAEMCVLTALMSAMLLSRHLTIADRARRLALLKQCLASVGLTVVLTTAVWWPGLEAAIRSTRQAMPEFQRTYWSLHPLSLLEVAYPLGNRALPLSQAWRSLLYEGREPFLASTYLGLSTIALALAAALTRQRRLFWAVLLAFALALAFALGRHTPFYGLATTALPFLRFFRIPQKTMVLVALCSALLAGIGFDVWRIWDGRRHAWTFRVLIWLSALLIAGWGIVAIMRGDTPRMIALLADANVAREVLTAGFARAAARLAVAVTLGTFVLALALFRWLGRAPLCAATAVAVAAVGDLAYQHCDLNATTQKGLYLHRPAVLDSLPRGGHARLYVYDYAYMPGRGRLELGKGAPYLPVRGVKGWSFEELGALAYRDALAPPTASAFGRESSFEPDFRGLFPHGVTDLDQTLLATEGTPTHLKLLRLAAVSHVVTLHTRGLGDLEPVASIPSLLAEPIRVWRVPDPLPRCYVVGGARVADDATAPSALANPTFDPETTVLLPSGETTAADAAFRGSCHIEELRPDTVRLSVTASSTAHVVLVDAYDPGWRATVDGKPVEVRRANVAFRAVPIAAGEHRVTLTYRPRSVVLGSALSLLGLVLTLGLLIGARSRPASP